MAGTTEDSIKKRLFDRIFAHFLKWNERSMVA